MDSLILEGVVRRLASVLPGKSLLRVDRVRDREYLLRFASAASDSLVISVRPPHPYLHRTMDRAPVRPSPPDPFCSFLARELEGATLRNLVRPSCDRSVEMVWENSSGEARVLVAELIGNSANLLLLDAERLVLAYARELRSTFRAPSVGKTYQPPIPPKGYEGVTWDPGRAPEYVDRFAFLGSPGEAAAGFLRGLSPSLGGDFLRREEAVEEPVSALAGILDMVRLGRLEPVLYTSIPLEEILRQPGATPAAPLLAPFPLRHPPLPVAAPVPDAEEASRLLTSILEGRRLELDLRGRLSSALHGESRRLQRLAEKLKAELAETERADEHQRYGDLLLAHPGATLAAGGFIPVIDLYHPLGPEVEVPADPALSPRENAERHYARARKLRRGAETIRGRIELVRQSLSRVVGWKERLNHSLLMEELRSLETLLGEARVIARPRLGPSRRVAVSSGNDPGIRKFRTREGFVILAGKTSGDNDRLTFQIASPHDFWFHSADRSGAHVVVRNSAKLKELPPAILLAAARIAAHFSRARGRGKVEVHYTLRKYVRKGRGLAPGRVILRNHRSVEVEPGIPGHEGGKE